MISNVSFFTIEISVTFLPPLRQIPVSWQISSKWYFNYLKQVSGRISYLNQSSLENVI